MPGFLTAAVGCGLFNPAVTAVALGSAPIEQSGLAAGVNDTFRQAGIAVGVAALGALVPAEAALGGGSPTEFVSGLHDALWVGGAVSLIGAIAATALIRSRPAEAQRRARRRAGARGGLAASTSPSHREPRATRCGARCASPRPTFATTYMGNCAPR